MAAMIAQHLKDQIKLQLQNSFSDLPFYGRLVAHKIDSIINDLHSFEDIDKKTTKVLIERYFEEDKFKELGESGEYILAQIKVIVTACYVLFALHAPENSQYLWSDSSHLVRMYPQFAQQDYDDLQILLRFRNILRVALLIVPPHKNKKFLLDIGGRLEGREQYTEYITGSGQKDSVKMRLIIYYTEANLSTTESDALYRAKFTRRSSAMSANARAPNANRRRAEASDVSEEQMSQLTHYPHDPIAKIAEDYNLLQRPNPLKGATDERILHAIYVMRRTFSDMLHFDMLMLLPLRLLIEQQNALIDAGQCDGADMHYVNEEKILKEVYTLEAFQQSKEQKRILDKMRYVMTACKLYLLSRTLAGQRLFLPEVDSLLQVYPEFAHVSGSELLHLLRFRNFMHLGLLVVPGRPKIFLLRVVERLEGADNQYITGKGQTEATDHRVLIYEREGGETAKPNAQFGAASSTTPIVTATRQSNKRSVSGTSPEDSSKRARTEGGVAVAAPSFAYPEGFGLSRPYQVQPPSSSSSSSAIFGGAANNLKREQSEVLFPPPSTSLVRDTSGDWQHINTQLLDNGTHPSHVDISPSIFCSTEQLIAQTSSMPPPNGPAAGFAGQEHGGMEQLPASLMSRSNQEDSVADPDEDDQEAMGNDVEVSREDGDATVDAVENSEEPAQEYSLDELLAYTPHAVMSRANTMEQWSSQPLWPQQQQAQQQQQQELPSGGLGIRRETSNGEPPLMRWEKDMGSLPLNFYFQPLFSMPAASVAPASSSSTSSAATASAAAVQPPAYGTVHNQGATGSEAMLDSIDMFNAPFTETVFGYFSFTETLQSANAIDRMQSTTEGNQPSSKQMPDAA